MSAVEAVAPASRTAPTTIGAALERNLIQTVQVMRLALAHMKGRAGAAIVNIASISGWSPQLAMSGQYGAAKATLIFGTER